MITRNCGINPTMRIIRPRFTSPSRQLGILPIAIPSRQLTSGLWVSSESLSNPSSFRLISGYGLSSPSTFRSFSSLRHHDISDNTAHEHPTCSLDNSGVFVHDATQGKPRESHFDSLWLRDHCRCSECFHPVTKQRLVDTYKIDPNIKPKQIKGHESGLTITWPDRHSSTYPWEWLLTNAYNPPLRHTGEISEPEKTLWDAEVAHSPPQVDYEEVMSGDKGVWKWLHNVNQFGFSFVNNVPPTPEATEKLVKRIGFIRETQYGTFWDFTSDLAKGDTAYTTLALSAHTDNTYFTDPAGLQLFHLLSHDGTGGESLLVDGFNVAAHLKERHPKSHRMLATTPIVGYAAGELTELYMPKVARPTLEYAPKPTTPASTDGTSESATASTDFGELVHVRWNNHDRAALCVMPGHLTSAWYDAARRWNELLTSKELEYWVQLKPGTALLMDNHRVLHGRAAFVGKRRMCGAYVGWDEYRSRFEVLQGKFGNKASENAGVWDKRF